ncbi:AraC family transcriptional regulator [Paenibacillus arenilitoris]|uniref:Helix-turn-helix transcriptional regulator n=1 Tax=Paenibacillus arenilitoris TaxID=2772299 RepID=A0A927HAT3_9BACL|nr:AraC family transcriptional regulator [Paenibacillus arenilitoris]MBD2872929.1 helix-turn-helix transcriptional regulator [Paenibacillus arenilitoris]
MKLELRSNLSSGEHGVPFTVYTVGMEQQNAISRLEGFSAHQLLITASGKGRVHLMDQNKWDSIAENTVLYIPAGFPNEYVPVAEGDWLVAFVSFHGSAIARASWGLEDAPAAIPVRSVTRLLQLVERIWRHSGADYDSWAASELLFALLTELRKQSAEEPNPTALLRPVPETSRSLTVLKAAKFMQDYMHRDISIAHLAEQVGYSQKQLTRLFLRTFQTTPLQYLRHVRLTAGQLLLETNESMTISQIARHVGMDPTYFTREFRRSYGVVPGEYRLIKAREAQEAARSGNAPRRP